MNTTSRDHESEHHSDDQPKRKDEPSGSSRIVREIKSIVLIVLIALFVRSTIIEAYQVPTGSMENTILVGDFVLGNKFIYGIRTPDWLGIPFTDIGFHVPHWKTPAFDTPEQGDVFIFRYPLDDRINYIKRLVAEPGQTVEIRNKILYVDGEEFDNSDNTKYAADRARPPHWQDPSIFPPGYGNKDNYGPFDVPAEGDVFYFQENNNEFIRYLIAQDGHQFDYRNGKYYVDGEEVTSYTVEQDYFFAMGDNRDNSWDSRYWGPVPAGNVLGRGMITYFSVKKNVPLYRIFEKVRWGRIGLVVK